MSVQTSIDRLISIKERIRINLVAQGIAVPEDAVLADMAEQILSVAGEPGVSATHSWDGTTLTITSASGTSSADLKGEKGVSVTSVEQTTTSNADGGTNVVTITLSNGQSFTCNIKNGSKGSAGTNGKDGTSVTHSWNGTKLTVTSASGTSSADLKGPPGDPATVTVDDGLSENSTNAIQNKVVTLALAEKQLKTVSVEILETICENIVFDNSNPTYTLPSAIALDSDAFYYLDCYYYEGDTSGALNEKYTLHAFTRLSNNMVKWASNNDDKAIILGPIDVVNNWRSPGHTNVVSIYKVKIIQDNPLFIAAMHATGYKTTAPGGYNANAEGHKTIALGYASHAEGRENYALGDYSHVEGAYNYAMGYASHVQGYGTIASSNYQHTEGKFNVTDDAGVYAHIVGNGTSEDSRSNAYTLDWEGNAWFAGNILGKQANVTEQVQVHNYTNSMSIWPNGLAGDPKEGSDESKLWIGSDGHGYFTNLYVTDGEAEKEVATKEYVDDNAVTKSGGTMQGALVAQTNTNYTTRQVRNIIFIAEGEDMPTGSNGDICFIYPV